MTNFAVGDILHITRKDNKEFDCFVVESIGNKQAFYGRYLAESSKDKVATASWDRYGLQNNGICVPIDECVSIDVLSKSSVTLVEDATGTKIFKNKINGHSINFCLSEGYGGWSFESNNESDALLEACGRVVASKKGM